MDFKTSQSSSIRKQPSNTSSIASVVNVNSPEATVKVCVEPTSKCCIVRLTSVRQAHGSCGGGAKGGIGGDGGGGLGSGGMGGGDGGGGLGGGLGGGGDGGGGLGGGEGGGEGGGGLGGGEGGGEGGGGLGGGEGGADGGVQKKAETPDSNMDV